MLAYALRSISNRRSVVSRPNQHSKRRFYATFEESPPTKGATPQFTAPPSSSGDSQTLPLVQKARALLESRKSGTFTSVSLKGENKHMPLFGSLMPYVLLPQMPGQPIVALRTDEKHYDHVQAGERASLVIFPLVPRSKSPKELPLPKLNITATCKPIVDTELIQTVLEKYEITHPGSYKFLKDRDLFHFYSMAPQDVFYVLSTSELDQFRGKDFCDAPVDPIAKDSRELVDDLNSKYHEELKMLCHEYGDVEVSDAMVIGVDRLGFDILGRVAASDNQWQEFRMPLDKSVEDIEEYRDFLEQACKEVRKVAFKRELKSRASNAM